MMENKKYKTEVECIQEQDNTNNFFKKEDIKSFEIDVFLSKFHSDRDIKMYFNESFFTEEQLKEIKEKHKDRIVVTPNIPEGVVLQMKDFEFGEIERLIGKRDFALSRSRIGGKIKTPSIVSSLIIKA